MSESANGRLNETAQSRFAASPVRPLNQDGVRTFLSAAVWPAKSAWKFPHRFLPLICFLFLFLLASCSVTEQRADLVIINGHEPESLDPAIGSTQEDIRVGQALFEGVTRNDPVTGWAIPSLAEKWDISPDGKVYTFHLRDNNRWSTGEPITSADFVYSWRRVLDPLTAAKYASQLFYVKNAAEYNSGKTNVEALGVQAVDARTFWVELNSPTAFFLDLCTLPTLAVVPRAAIEKYGDQWVRHYPVPSSGAYKLEAWRLNDKIRMRKNPYYWDAANTKTELVDWLPISMPSTALNLYDTGIADIIWDKDIIPEELMDELKRRPDYHTFNYFASYFARINVTKAPFTDVRVRRALALALDKKHLIERILRGGEQASDHLVPEGAPNYTPPKGLGYDPVKARQLLAEAGFPGGQGFPTFNYLIDSGSGNNIHSQIAVELQHAWEQELGIHMEIRQMEKKIYVAAQNSLDYNVSRSSWVGDYNDPNTFLDLFRSDNGNNRTGWKNARYDDLMHQADFEPDVKKRAADLEEAETLLVADEIPIIPLYIYVGFNYYNPTKIKGIYPNVLDQHPVNDIWKVAGK